MREYNDANLLIKEVNMVKTPLFKGSCTALITPLNETGVDYERLKKNIDLQYENGTAAIVICGTTGENAVQSQDEHDELVRVAVNHTAGRMTVIAGIGSNNDNPNHTGYGNILFQGGHVTGFTGNGWFSIDNAGYPDAKTANAADWVTPNQLRKATGVKL